MSVFVYAIQFESGEIYMGISCDLERRMAEHRSRKSSSTKRFKGSFKLVYKKEFADHKQARIHEKFLKSGAGHKFLSEHQDI